MKKLMILLMILLMIASIFAGCSKKENNNAENVAGNSATSKDYTVHGDSLFFPIKNGNIVKLVNKPYTGNNDIEASINYVYLGIDPEFDSYKLQYTGYESGYTFINRTSGKITHFADKVVFSPNRKYLCTWREDLEQTQSGNLLELYEFRKDGFEAVYSDAPQKWGPQDALWLEDGVLVYNREVMEDNVKKIVSVDTLRLVGNYFRLYSLQNKMTGYGAQQFNQ